MQPEQQLEKVFQQDAATVAAFPEWVIFHVPHDSVVIPVEVRNQFVLNDAELNGELIRMTDHLTGEIFTSGVNDKQVIKALVSRLVVDVERFDNDRYERMASKGMGAVYLQTSDARPLRHPITLKTRVELMNAWYWPHHNRLASATQDCLDHFGQALLIDAHSFASMALPYEEYQFAQRPDICIGTDPFHTPKTLEQAFVKAFTEAGFKVAVNSPFAGAMVSGLYFGKEARVNAVMVEVNKSLYLDESTGKANEKFSEVSRHLRHCIATAIEAWMRESDRHLVKRQSLHPEC